MLKLEPSSDGEPKDEPEMLHDQGPSFEELMMLVFSGPLRFECLEETETEPDVEAKDHEQQ